MVCTMDTSDRKTPVSLSLSLSKYYFLLFLCLCSFSSPFCECVYFSRMFFLVFLSISLSFLYCVFLCVIIFCPFMFLFFFHLFLLMYLSLSVYLCVHLPFSLSPLLSLSFCLAERYFFFKSSQQNKLRQRSSRSGSFFWEWCLAKSSFQVSVEYLTLECIVC